jgi:hypothetical protein
MCPLNHIVGSPTADVGITDSAAGYGHRRAELLRLDDFRCLANDPIPDPHLPKRKAAQGALLLAVSVLQDERVREQLRKAPIAAREWAANRRADDWR